MDLSLAEFGIYDPSDVKVVETFTEKVMLPFRDKIHREFYYRNVTPQILAEIDSQFKRYKELLNVSAIVESIYSPKLPFNYDIPNAKSYQVPVSIDAMRWINLNFDTLELKQFIQS